MRMSLPRFLLIFAADPANVWAVGPTGLIRHWNGTAWEKEASPETIDCNAVWGSSAADVWIAPSGSGSILRRVQGVWTKEAQTASNHLTSIAGTGPDDVWMSGESAQMVHWDGVKWTAIEGEHVGGSLAIGGNVLYVGSLPGFVQSHRL
jgi:hypothetical protein